ncbi:alkene reductase [Terriglobus tenax]|uniref:alkene reductase n=1 Tax=Terriglobus tenax TaxID=1111115 RepID=UPI0021E091C5|nr:alkene reductase [Terriglobus tenax]
MATIFDPIRVGDLELPNRIFMAPLTRLRATPNNVPTPIMVDYYRKRASAGLIITEATPVDPLGIGYSQVPGIWSQEQVEAWKPITRAVKEAGGHIFMQLWHVGRISHSSFHNGALPVAPSAIAAQGHVSLIRPITPFETPRALTLPEVKDVIEQFRRGAQNAQAAGFDGVHIHGANGYLLDQFLQDGANHRTDEYGGPIENRARLMLEVTDAAIGVWGANRVGVHLAPRSDSHDISDSNRPATFGYVATELGKRKIAFIAAREHVAPDSLGPELKKKFGGVYVANENFTLDSANQAIAAGWADAVAFGKPFIANADLVRRLREGKPLNTPVPETFYGHTEVGYSDYPELA